MTRRWTALGLAAASAVLGASSAVLPAAAHAQATSRAWTPQLRATAGTGLANPATNVPPSPDYWPTCAQSGVSSQACLDAVVTAIDNARAKEGVGKLVLPPGFASLTTAQQTFVVSNLERVDRGLSPAVGMVDTLSSLSRDAAVADADPMLASWTVGPFSATRWASIWAGDLNPLAADYDWMYNDGWGPTGSYNLDCQTATAAGCWGHRDAVLAPDDGRELITGVGSVVQSRWTSIAQIFVAGSGSYPPFTFAWSDVTGEQPAVGAADVTTATVTAPARIVAGATTQIVGTLTDTTTGGPVLGATVKLCQRAVDATRKTCQTLMTGNTGQARVTVYPTVSTDFWMVFAGSSIQAASKSGHSTVRVRPSVSVHATRTSLGRRIDADLTPARGQSVQLQRQTASGWLTVRETTASTSMSFTHVRVGTYRLVISRTAGSLPATANVQVT